MSQEPIFQPQRCDVESVLPIPESDWFRDTRVPQAPQEIFDCGISPIPMPPPDVPCPDIQTGVVVASTSLVPQGGEGMLFTILAGDCCSFDFDIQVFFPITCGVITPQNEWKEAETEVVAFGNEKLQFQFVTVADCEWDLQVSISWPCPNLTPTDKQEAEKSIVEIGEEKLEFQFVKSPDCDWDLDITIAFPCPILEPQAKTEATKSIVEIGSEKLEIQFTKSGDCTWTLDATINFPCPALEPQSKTEATKSVVEVGSEKLEFQFTKSGDCTWTLDVTIDFPCPIMEPSEETPATSQALCQSEGELKFAFAKSDDCSWELSIDVTFPKMPAFNAGFLNVDISASTLSCGAAATATGSMIGNGWLNAGDCTYYLDLDLTLELGIPRGCNGQQGPRGYQGPPGPAGGKYAIMPVGDMFLGWFCLEGPESWFVDILRVPMALEEHTLEIDLDWRVIASCEDDSLFVVSCQSALTEHVAGDIVDGQLHLRRDVRQSDLLPTRVTVLLAGIRRGFGGERQRFPQFTERQYRKNLEFYDSAYGPR